MLSARLNKVIEIEKGVEGLTSVGSPTLEYESYITTYAGVIVRSNTARYNEYEQLVITTEFDIRYNSLTKEINNKYRVKYNDNYYRILEVIETEPNHALKIIAVSFYNE